MVGRPRKPAHEPEEHEEPKPESKAEGKTVKITYRPIEAGDPHEAVWDGLTFQANVPKPVAASRKDMIESAKGNPWFEVEGHPRAKRKKPTAEPVPPAGGDADPVAFDDKRMVEADDE